MTWSGIFRPCVGSFFGNFSSFVASLRTAYNLLPAHMTTQPEILVRHGLGSYGFEPFGQHPVSYHYAATLLQCSGQYIRN